MELVSLWSKNFNNMSRASKTKKKSTRSRTRRNPKSQLVSLRKLFWVIVLTSFLFFSLGSLGYVIFFRTVLAAEIISPESGTIIFEEPDPPLSDKPGMIVREKMTTSPRIAIIIDDMGFHRKVGEQLLNLPINLTFSFLPNAPFTKVLEEQAHLEGRTVLLHLPLQPRDQKWDPGPGTLYLGEMEKQREIFEKNLASVPHAVGVNNHMGSLYSEDKRHMAGLIEIIRENNLFYIDSFTTSESVGFMLAQEMGLKTARRHVFLDNLQSKEKICEQLGKLAILAEEQGWAIGIGHPYPQTLEALNDCQTNYSTKVQLVSVEELVN